MADLTQNYSGSTPPGAAQGAQAAATPGAWLDGVFKGATFFFALLVLVLLGGVIVSLISGSLPAFEKFGAAFLWTSSWNPAADRFGAWPAIYGTLVSSLIAMLIGVPLSFGIATFLTELCPARLKRPIGICIELLAGIPSIIYGIWGLFVFAPILQDTLQPFLINTLGNIPVIGALFQGPPLGIGVFSAGLILAIMILPFITSIMRDVFETVPPMLKESAYGLGATTWEVMWRVVLPYTRTGVVGGVMLGLGRALGETMAVTFVIGNATRVSNSILAPGTTISAMLANQFNEAQGDVFIGALFALGLILFVITFFVLAAAKLLLAKTGGPK